MTRDFGTASGNPTGSDATGSSLCTRCGLCCMGVLHDTAVLDEEEVALANDLGLPVAGGDRPCFILPCPRLEGTRCGVYENRPAVCARYRCQVLQDVQSGETGLAEAMQSIELAKGLLNDLTAVLPAGTSLMAARRLVRYSQVPADLEHLDVDEVRVRMSALQLFIDQRFRNARDKTSFHDNLGDNMADEPSATCYRRSAEALFSEIGEDIVSLQVTRGRCHGMADVAAEVWRLLATPSTVEDLCRSLQSDYAVDPEECLADVSELLETLAAEGLVEPVPTS